MWPGKKRILVVDDESDITLTLYSVLQESGFEVAFFNDSLLALRSFKPHYYDLLILRYTSRIHLIATTICCIHTVLKYSERHWQILPASKMTHHDDLGTQRSRSQA
jgi:DNA-binding NtrC family response regulator